MECTSFSGVNMERLGIYIRFPNQDNGANDFVGLLLDYPVNHEYLTLSSDITLRQLSEIIAEIKDFKSPLKNSLIEMLVFFTSKCSVLFDKHLHLKVERHFELGNEVRHFADALEDTYRLFDKIVSGEVAYFEISGNGALQLDKLDIAREFAIVSEYFKIYHEVSGTPFGGLATIQKKLELLQYRTVIEDINSACKFYGLKSCVQDPTLDELRMIMAETTKSWSTMTHDDVIVQLKKVRKVFHLKDNQSAEDLSVFIAVIGNADFLTFLKEKKFCDHQGRDIFYKQYQLITAQLQHEGYDDDILSHLFAAFQIISPFMDTKINFKELMKQLKDLNIVDAAKFFDTVKQNISLIRLWFSRAEVNCYVIMCSGALP